MDNRRLLAATALLVLVGLPAAHAIMAGGETALPADSPSNRLDPLGAASPFNVVGALAISSGGFNYKGSGVALSPNWVLTAGHNLDLNDNGLPDPGLAINFNLPGFGAYSASGFYTHPAFTGFGNPSIQRDLGLLYFATPLPASLIFPSLSYSLHLSDDVALVGFGRSGYGDYGYTTSAGLTDRRIGWNVVDSFTADDLGGGFPALFRYDFDSPDTTGEAGGSLGNAVETLIGPGDSGGPLLVDWGTGYAVAGISTFVEGYGGRFGDIGGGIVTEHYLGWISEVTGIVVPEPTAWCLLLMGLAFALAARQRAGQGRGGRAAGGRESWADSTADGRRAGTARPTREALGQGGRQGLAGVATGPFVAEAAGEAESAPAISSERMVMAMRRLRARPSGVALSATGRNSP